MTTKPYLGRDLQDVVTSGSDGDVLAFDESSGNWVATPVNATKLQGNNIGATSPSSGQALVWDDVLQEWKPGDVAASGGGGGGDPSWYIDGLIISGSDSGGVYICPRDTEIEAVYIHCKNKGSAGSTIVDVNLNGTTIFTTQGNRPTLAYDDADGVAKSGTPDVVTLSENDILTIDIDQVATDAESLTVLVAIVSESGGSASVPPAIKIIMNSNFI